MCMCVCVCVRERLREREREREKERERVLGERGWGEGWRVEREKETGRILR